MKFWLLSMIAVSLLLFGCVDSLLGQGSEPPASPAINPSSPPQPDDNELPPAPPAGTPAQSPPSPSADLPSAPPANPPAQNTTPAPAPKPAPSIYKYGLLDMGQGIDFSEGSVWLEDIAAHETQLAFLTAKTPTGEISKKAAQALPGSPISYVSPSGRKFWLYVSMTGGGMDIQKKWAKVFVLEAKEEEGDNRFLKSLYADFIGDDTLGKMEYSSLLGSQVSRGLLDNTQILDAKNFLVRFDDLNKYSDAGTSTALVSILDSNGVVLDKAKIPQSHAYIFSAPSGGKYAIYNEGGGVGQSSGVKYASLRVTNAGSGSPQAKRLYSAQNWKQNKSTSFVEKLTLPSYGSVMTEREFSLRLKDSWYTNAADLTAAIEVLDEDGYVTDFGIARKDLPFLTKDKYGRTYEIWLDSLSFGQATVSLYRH
ncbi:MAG: hypothetical protein QW568_01070 [Candidatus Anstonellaceae archaeon]